MTTIRFHGKNYTLFEVTHAGSDRFVAHESLEDELMPGGHYADDEAKAIDEAIYFYVADSVETDDEAQRFTEENCF